MDREGYLEDGVDVRELNLWMFCHGLLNLEEGGGEITKFPIPATVLPTPVCLEDYESVRGLQAELNTVLDRMSLDREFIIEHLTPVAQHDAFVAGLLEIYKNCTDSEDAISLGLFRHDFMYDVLDPDEKDACLKGSFKMVEVNLMAASMGSLAEGVSRYHDSILNKHFNIKNHQHQRLVQGQAEGLVKAWRHYNVPSSVVLLVEDSSFNWFDQQILLSAVEAGQVNTRRCSMQEIVTTGRLEGNKYFVGQTEVAVFYFRSMYDPHHFKTTQHWTVREEIEKSRAVKVPSIRHQIINMKLFQMLLCKREVLARYSPQGSALSSVFGQVLSLDKDEEGDRNSQLGLDRPDQYVMKPQREGGGNNLWDDEMVQMLTELTNDERRSSYILMKKLQPPHVRNRFIRRGVLSDVKTTVSELGIYSVYLKVGNTAVEVNEVVGSLVRTKSHTDNEGGVAVGIGHIDSAHFVSRS